MSEDLGEEDIVGLVFRFEVVATDGAVGASEVAGFPGFVQGAEGGGNVLGELRELGRPTVGMPSDPLGHFYGSSVLRFRRLGPSILLTGR
jgi:hypothetical protein